MTNALLTTDSQEFKKISVPSDLDNTNITWGGAGSVIAVSTKEGVFLPFGLRNETAPVFKTQLGTASGNIDDSDSQLYPEHTAIRESSEEILMYDRTEDSWVVPKTGNPETDSISKGAITKTVQELRTKMNYPTTEEFHTIPSQRFELSDKETKIESGEESRMLKGLIISEPRLKTTDYLDLLVVDYSHRSIAELTFFDGELLESPTPERQREIYLFTLDQFKGMLNQPVTVERIFRYGELYATKHKTETTRDFSEGYQFREILPLYYLVGKSHSKVCEVLDQNL